MYGIASPVGYGTTGRCHVTRGITNNDNTGPTQTSVRLGATTTASASTAGAVVYSTILTIRSISTITAAT